MSPITADRVVRRANAAFLQRAGSFVRDLLGGAGRFVVVAGLACAVIIGIVAMHSLVSPTSHSEMAMSTTMSSGGSDAGVVGQAAATVASPDCIGCGDDSSLALMWCVLALLTVSLLVAAPTLVRGWGHYREQRLTASAPFSYWAQALPRRPDLTLLCISRT